MIWGHLSVLGLSGSLRHTTCVSDPTLGSRRAEHQDGADQWNWAPLCSQAWPWSSSVARKVQGKKRRRGNENSEAQVFCVTGGGLGCPGPAQGTSLHWSSSSETPGFGRWLQFRLGKVGDQEAGMLLDLLGPFHVVRPRLLTGQALDDVLQAPPEAYHL